MQSRYKIPQIIEFTESQGLNLTSKKVLLSLFWVFFHTHNSSKGVKSLIQRFYCISQPNSSLAKTYIERGNQRTRMQGMSQLTYICLCASQWSPLLISPGFCIWSRPNARLISLLQFSSEACHRP